MIYIQSGTYKIRGKDTDVSDIPFEQVGDFKYGASGGYITVDGRSAPGFPERNIKIRVESEDCIMNVGEQVELLVPNETDDEIIERLRKRFDILEKMTKAAKKGDVKGMVVVGPPGIGKSHGVEKVLDKHATLSALAGSEEKYEFVKGKVSALGLFMKLWYHRKKDHVIVFDDCDDIFHEDTSLNLLKAALDTKAKRRICWNTDSRKLKDEGIDNVFDFEGSVIFITNVKFDNIRSKKLQDHLKALESRCHYLDLEINTEYEIMLRIKQITLDGMLNSYGFEQQTVDDIVEYVETNKGRLRELSLRSIIKIADLAKAFGENDWASIADHTMLRRGS
tara:strand:+ start:2492 stop:3499 length:1008 start_codon:yes stop_codon:yes gene_type:complete